MGQRPRHNHKRHRPSGSRRAEPVFREPVAYEKKVPTTFGKAFILLEDGEKNTFEFASGEWVPYAMKISECRQDCEVKELPQKVKGMTRYEVRLPLPAAE